ncbi:MobA/MobL family protein [Microvirga sp. GCM10011540]|uniref:MobA/MobL family protein n=1 Tax=Microvirga sp. GCM10011540 TaxID=3317338 RepID=UPI0036734AD2
MTKVVQVRVKYGPVSRSKGWTARMRSTYQAGGLAPDLQRIVREFRLEPGEHRGQWLLTPPQAPEWAENPVVLWSRAGAMERRYDAQEARYLDIQWPRAMPVTLSGEVVTEVYDLFKNAGLAVQIDMHVVPARDGGENPHLHGLISTRTLGREGFDRTKARDWNRWFRAEGGRQPLRHVAAALAKVAARHGMDLQFETRTNVEQGLPYPEDRLPRSVFRKPDTVAAQALLANLEMQRSGRRALERAEAECQHLDARKSELHTRRGELYRSLPRLEPDPAALADPAPLTQGEIGRIIATLTWIRVRNVRMLDGETAILVGDGSLFIDRGDHVLVDGPADDEALLVLHEIARAKGWHTTAIRTPNDGAANPEGVSVTSDGLVVQSRQDKAREQRSGVGTVPEGSPQGAKERPRNAAGWDFRPTSLARIGYRNLVEVLTSNADRRFAGKRNVVDAHVRRGGSISNLIRHLRLTEPSSAPQPGDDDLIDVIRDSVAGEPAAARGWAAWKVNLELSFLAQALPGGLGSRPGRTQGEYTVLAEDPVYDEASPADEAATVFGPGP